MVEIDKTKAINLAKGKDLKDLKRKPQEIPVSELTQEQKNVKRHNITEHLDQLMESLHYAKQDLNVFILKADINHPEKRLETQRAVDDMTKEIEFYKKKLSELNAG